MIKTITWASFRIKKFCFVRNRVYRMQKHAIERGEIFAKYVLERKVIQNIQRILKDSINNKTMKMSKR